VAGCEPGGGDDTRALCGRRHARHTTCCGVDVRTEPRWHFLRQRRGRCASPQPLPTARTVSPSPPLVLERVSLRNAHRQSLASRRMWIWRCPGHLRWTSARALWRTSRLAARTMAHHAGLTLKSVTRRDSTAPAYHLQVRATHNGGGSVLPHERTRRQAKRLACVD
jgi:hypothetical protein